MSKSIKFYWESVRVIDEYNAFCEERLSLYEKEQKITTHEYEL